MSSPVPSPVPAGTEREAVLERALREIGQMTGYGHRGSIDDAVSIARSALAAVVSSSPATPAWVVDDLPRLFEGWVTRLDETPRELIEPFRVMARVAIDYGRRIDAAPSPASPAETAGLEARLRAMATAPTPVRPAREDAWDGLAQQVEELHRPEPGGCTCGFCAWSVQHVAIYVARAVAAASPAETREGGWPDPPYYAEDMARLLRDAADQAPFRVQGGPDYCNGLRRAADLVEEFGVASPAVSLPGEAERP